MCSDQSRTYERNNCIVFLKTKEAFGGLSNMAGGFPLRVNGIRIFTSEALYQACRFPHLPDVQRIVLDEPSPMTSKMKSKPYRQNSRPDWDQVRVRVMRWCLRVKLVQNWKAFGDLLLATDDKPIVEESRKDDFWGANPVDEHTLVGMNVLGRLLMELREEFKSDRRDALLRVEPLQIPDFMLMGQPIPIIEALAQDRKRLVPDTDVIMKSAGQPSLFDQPALFDVKAVSIPMHEVNEPIPQTYANSHTAITDLKPYPEYKESGLPWLGQVPGHWGMRRTKVLLRERVEKGFPNEPLLAATQSKGVVRKADYGTRTVTAQKDFHLLKLVEVGDFVISLRSFEGGIEVAHSRGIISPAYTVLEPRSKATRGYLRHFFKSPTFISSLTLFVTGIREGQNIDYERLSRAFLPLPPDEEQAAIVRFLDHSLLQLDKAIRAKRKTIALLNEQKQAIIHRAVTRGLVPSVSLKPSGIPWLGDIPQHWEVRKLRSLFHTQGSGTTPSGDYYYGGSINWVMSGDLNDSVVRKTKRTVHGEALTAYSTLKLYPPNSLVVAMYGATIGKTGILGKAACTNQACCVLAEAMPGVNVSLIQLVLHTAKPHLLREAYGGGQPNINAEVVRSLRVPFPPFEEQNSLLAHVRKATMRLTATISRLEREIELLREYRTRLITDVVTGKLDVREVAVRLPKEFVSDSVEEESDLCDETESAFEPEEA